jgi:hypothetical protein
MIKLNNPFGTSMTIRDPQDFYGRLEVLDYLYSEIIAHRCVSVIGTRRIGKSSLLYCLSLPAMQQKFASIYNLSKHILIYLDMGEFLSCTMKDFFTLVCTQLIVQTKDCVVLDPLIKFDGEERFWRLLEQLQDKGFHPILLLDGFQKITRNKEFDPKFFAFMRAQANMGRVSYITASITTLDKCCHAYIEGSPFFNIFLSYRLGPLNEEEARQLLTLPDANAGITFTDEEVEHILTLAGRNPFFLQRTAFLTFREKTQARPSDTRQISAEIYQDLLPHFNDIWEHSLEQAEREVLKGEAHWKNVSQRKLPELSESLLFRRFIRNTCNIRLVDISLEALELALENYRDTRTLAESELTQLYLFFAYTQHITRQLSINDKAIYARKILQEARDQLMPTNVPRSDIAVEWQAVNILNYRYFIEHLKNDVLAARIGISVRQLHRERKIAVEALYQKLVEMEARARENLDNI